MRSISRSTFSRAVRGDDDAGVEDQSHAGGIERLAMALDSGLYIFGEVSVHDRSRTMFSGEAKRF